MSPSPQLDPPRELHDLVRSTLARNPYIVGRRLTVEVRQRDVILRGAVGSYHQKQIAQESIRRIAGLGAIRNELEVPGT